MLYLDPDLSSLQGSISTQLDQLAQLASLSLLDDQSAKDEAHQYYLELAYQFHLNSIQGGLFEPSGDLLCFDLGKNADLAYVLLAASHCFFDGELGYLAEQSLRLLFKLTQLESNNGQWPCRFYFTKEASEVCGQQLHHDLDDIELKLLTQLLQTPIDQQKNYPISYRTSLKNAAQLAGLEYKQAQILAQQLQNRLSRLMPLRLVKTEREKQNTPSSPNFSSYAKLLSTTAFAILWHKKTQLRDDALKLEQRIQQQMAGPAHLSASEILLGCAALMDALQLAPLAGQNDLGLLIDCLNLLRQKKLNGSEAKNLSNLSRLCQALSARFDPSFPANTGSTRVKIAPFELLFLATDPVQAAQDRHLAFSCFNPGLKVYQPTAQKPGC